MIDKACRGRRRMGHIRTDRAVIRHLVRLLAIVLSSRLRPVLWAVAAAATLCTPS